MNQPDWGTVWDFHSPSDCLDCLNPVYLVSAQVDSQRVGVQDELWELDALVYLKTFTWQDWSRSPESHVCSVEVARCHLWLSVLFGLKGPAPKFKMRPAYWNVTSEIHFVTWTCWSISVSEISPTFPIKWRRTEYWTELQQKSFTECNLWAWIVHSLHLSSQQFSLQLNSWPCS